MVNVKPTTKTPSVDMASHVDSRGSSRLTQKAYLNAVTALLNYAVTAAVAFVLNPILLNGLGSGLFGVLVVLRRLIDFMSVADGRPTQALKWDIARQQGSDDHAAKRHSIGSAVGVLLIFTPVLVAIGAILVWISPWMVNASAELRPLIHITSFLLVANALLFGFVYLPEAVLRGMNLDYKRMGLRPVITIVGGGLTVAAIYLGYGLAGVAAAALMTSFIAAIWNWGTVRRYIPWFGIVKPTLAGIRRFFSFGGWFFGWALVNKALLAGDVVVLGLVASTESVTVYALTGYVARAVVGIISLIFGAVTPGMGGLIGKKQLDLAANVRSEMMSISWLLTVSIGVAILVWNRSFVNLWVGKEFYAGSLANFLIVFILVQLVFIRNDSSVIDLTLNLREKVFLGGLSTLLSLGLAAVLIKPLGIVGLCLGLIAGRSILTVIFPILAGSALKISPRIHIAGLARPGIVMFGAFVLSAYLGHHVVANTWIEFFSFAGLSFAIALGFAFVVGLTMRQRVAIATRFGQIQLLQRP